jgi:hypothetical protein
MDRSLTAVAKRSSFRMKHLQLRKLIVQHRSPGRIAARFRTVDSLQIQRLTRFVAGHALLLWRISGVKALCSQHKNECSSTHVQTNLLTITASIANDHQHPTSVAGPLSNLLRFILFANVERARV